MNYSLYHYIAPKTLPGFPKAKRVTPKTPVKGGGGLRARWKDDNGDILEWDSQHGRVEKYNKRGKHKGEFDPDDGSQTKPADSSRKITPTETRPMERDSIQYVLACYLKDGDEFVNETIIDIEQDEVRTVLKLSSDQSVSDCLAIGESELVTLKLEADIDLTSYDYFLEARRA